MTDTSGNHVPDRQDDFTDQMQAAIFSGRKIEAIKLYRTRTGKNLKEAKAFVDGLEQRLRQEAPEKFQAPSGSAGCASSVLVLCAALGVALFAVAMHLH